MLILLGAGLTGLSCALKLSEKKASYIVIEKNSRPGGLCRTEEKDGFLFDFSGHLLHLRWEHTSNFVKELLNKNIKKIKRDAKIYLKGRYIDYPFQINLYNLPNKIKNRCVRDFIVSRFENEKPDPLNFKDWSYKLFGKAISEYFMIPYNEKLYSSPAQDLTALWIEGFVPIPSLSEVISGAYIEKVEGKGYNSSFYYPIHGGIESLVKKIYEKVKKNIMLQSEVIAINFCQKKIKLNNSKEIKYSKLVSTIPLKNLILNSDAPDIIKSYAKKLKHNSVHVLNLGIKNSTPPYHWIYFAQREIPFYRIGFYTNFSKNLAPDGFSSVYVEFSSKPEETFDKNKAKSQTLKWLKLLGIIKNEKDIITDMWLDIDCAYVIYDREREKAVENINNFLREKDVVSTGRYGGWKYSFMEENIKDGFKAAERLI